MSNKDKEIYKVIVKDRYGEIHEFSTDYMSDDFKITVQFDPSMFTDGLAGVVEIDLFCSDSQRTVCFLEPISVDIVYE